MKWLGLIVAIVLTGASFLPHAWAQPSPLTYAQPLSQTGVMAVQQRLKQNGAYAGQTDGVWGPDSAAALEQFQRAHGLLPRARNQLPRWPKEANNRACGARNPRNMLKASKAS